MINTIGSYLYSYNLGGSNSVSGGHISGVLLVVFFILLLLAVFYIICLWKVFIKAGKPGWAAIVPVYNGWVYFEISGKPGWWVLFGFLGFIPVVGYVVVLVLSLIASMELAKRFGKDTVFGVVLLWLFGFIGLPILAFGDAAYSTTPKSAGMPPGPEAVQ